MFSILEYKQFADEPFFYFVNQDFFKNWRFNINSDNKFNFDLGNFPDSVRFYYENSVNMLYI